MSALATVLDSYGNDNHLQNAVVLRAHDPVVPVKICGASDIAAARYTSVSTPVGDMLIATAQSDGDDMTVIWAAFTTPRTFDDAVDQMRQTWPETAFHHDAVRSDSLKQTVEAFLDGKADVLPVPGLSVSLCGTVFQTAIWKALAYIPHGMQVTYGDLARSLGYGKNAARAIGAAVGRNPVSLFIPCHRIIGASGKLTGYRWGLEVKQQLLDRERS